MSMDGHTKDGSLRTTIQEMNINDIDNIESDLTVQDTDGETPLMWSVRRFLKLFESLQEKTYKRWIQKRI